MNAWGGDERVFTTESEPLCFDCSQDTDHNFFKKENEKKMGRNDRYKKVYQARFCLVQKVSTRHKSTFFRLLAHGML